MARGPVARFRLGRRALEAADGETVLGALARRGLPNVVRSVRYHRPRGPFCGTGDCTGCLVRVNGRPNVRACRHEVVDGDRVETDNAWPSPRFDLLGAIDLLFPSGIDTLHGFRRPRFAVGAYQRVIRRLAGYSAAPTDAAAAAIAGPLRRYDVDVAIVGAGPAGAGAAERLVAGGVRPLLVDRDRTSVPVPGAEALARTTVTYVPPPSTGADRRFDVLGFEAPGLGVVVRCRSLVVATGSYDASLLFGGSDRPGVVAAELALRLSPPGTPSPFRRVVVFGGGARAKAVVDRLGASVAAVVAPGEIGPDVARAASDLGAPLYPRTLLLAAAGRGRVRSVALKGRGGGPRFHVRCDGIVLAHRRLPNGRLLQQAGAATEWRADVGAHVPRVDPGGATTVAGLFVAGSLAGAAPGESRASGERAADAVLAAAPPLAPGPGPADAAPGELEGYYRELLREPRHGKWIACPCEDVLLDEVERAARTGYTGVEVVKRYTGLGTGLCQGRYCLPDALLLLSILERRPPAEVGTITPRPPAVPMPLAALAALSEEFPPEVVP